MPDSHFRSFYLGYPLKSLAWNDSFSYPRRSVKLLDHPQLLLEKIKAFIGNLQIEDYREFSTLAYNTEYIDGKKFNFCLLPESNYELFTIEVSEN